MVETTRAIVFSAIKYAEADLIVTAFTQNNGLKSYLLRGVLKSKKGKLKASYFLPLTQLEIVAHHKNKGTLERISEAKVSFPYSTLHTEIVKSTLVMFLAEALKNAVQEEEENILLFQFIEASLQWLDHHDSIGNFHILFLLKLTEYLGCYPDTSNTHFQYFNIEEGFFQEEDISIYSYTGPVIANFKKFFGINFDTMSGIKLSKKERFDLLNLVVDYYQLHLQSFKKPKSLSVLNQLFN